MSTIKDKKSSKVHTRNPVKRMEQKKKQEKRENRIFVIARRSILVVIVLAMMAVILLLLFTSFTKPERTVTNKIESITADYYENYFYDRIKDYDNLKNYTEHGFSKVTLRQLLLFDSERHADAADLLNKYCDGEKTYVKIYPEAPFGNKNYHVEYYYACTF